jgi:hypothetical protein
MIGGIMENLGEKFNLCDPRFIPYLEKVFSRLPPVLKEEILETTSFQFLADDAFHKSCAVRHTFEEPVETLVLLNTRMLKEPEHRILLTIASEIAYHVVGIKKSDADKKEVESLLKQWGFENEIEAVRYDQIIEKSPGYKIGYQWARSQNKGYLLQHFGLYFDDWKKMSWGKKSEDILNMVDQKADTASILEEITQFKEIEIVQSDDKAKVETPVARQAIIAGIVTALKEIELLEQTAPPKCETRQI